MNFLDAAYTVLKQASEPLHYAEITRRALATNLLDTKGQTPEATMASRLYVDTKEPGSHFRRVGRNVFALAQNQPPEIIQLIQTNNDTTREQLRIRLLAMPPDRFEALMGELLLALGFEEDTLHVTPYGKDGGIDVRGILNVGNVTEVNVAVQVKRWKSNVQAPVVTELRGSISRDDQGIIITTSKFSSGAQVEAKAPGKARISLVDGDKVLDLLIRHRIGVKAEQHFLYSLDHEWWNSVMGAPGANLELPGAEQNGSATIRYPLAIQANAQGQLTLAELLSSDGRVRMNGIEYRSPSKAAQVATGWKSCNGWVWWHCQHPETGNWVTIDELRPIIRNSKSVPANDY